MSEIKQKKLIKKWLISEDEEFKKKNIIVTIFYVIAVIAFLIPPLYMYIKVPSERYSSETFMLSILFGVILGIVIFIIANSLKNKVYNDCGFPYTLERSVVR